MNYGSHGRVLERYLMTKELSLPRPASPSFGKASRPALVHNRTPSLAAGSDLDTLRAIVEGTAGSTGQEFFQALVHHLASAVGVPFAAVSEFASGNKRVRTIAFWGRDRIQDNFEYDLAGTPCDDVVRGRLCHHPAGVKDAFPKAK